MSRETGKVIRIPYRYIEFDSLRPGADGPSYRAGPAIPRGPSDEESSLALREFQESPSYLKRLAHQAPRLLTSARCRPWKRSRLSGGRAAGQSLLSPPCPIR